MIIQLISAQYANIAETIPSNAKTVENTRREHFPRELFLFVCHPSTSNATQEKRIEKQTQNTVTTHTIRY